MDEGQNLNNGGSGLGAAGSFDAFQNNNTFQNAGVGMQGSNSVGGMMGNDAPGAVGGIGVSGPIVSSGDDIMLGSGGDNGEQRSRKRLLLGVVAVIVVFALVAVGVFAMWKGGVRGDGDGESISDILKNEYSNVKGVEDFFGHVYSGDVSFGMIYENENVVSSLGHSVGEFDVFYNKIKSISEQNINNKDKNAVIEMREISGRRIVLYDEFNKLITIFYQVYSGHINDVQDLLNSDDKNVANLAVQFDNYLVKRGQLLTDIDANGCSSWLEKSEVCEKLYSEYRMNEDFITDGDVLANIVTNILSLEDYGNEHELTDLMNEILFNNGVTINA